MKLLVGLGNPGAEHAGQRHNIGFMAADTICARHALGPMRRRFQGEACEGRLGSDRVLVLKPLTYMNESGRSVGEAARFYKLDAQDVIVLHDEIDLAAGKVRVKIGGGVAGHNGLRSLAAQIGPDFTRVRIGIGHPGDKHKVHRHVLGDFAKADSTWVEPLLEAIAANAEKLAAGDNANFMNAVSQALQSAGNDKSATPIASQRKSRTAGGEKAEQKAPTQRDLARKAAERTSSRSSQGRGEATPRSATDETPSANLGPFARLRRLFAAPDDERER